MTFKKPAHPAGSRRFAPLPAPLYRRMRAVGGKTAVKPLLKGFIQVGWAVKSLLSKAKEPIYELTLHAHLQASGHFGCCV
jgi:hypothetical protein